jgi:hypothetical protein
MEPNEAEHRVTSRDIERRVRSALFLWWGIFAAVTIVIAILLKGPLL